MKIFFRLPKILQPLQRHFFSDISDSNLPIKQQGILRKIESFIIQRFEIFKDEIDAEESNIEKVPKVMIDFSEEGNPEIRYVNYSEKLTTKMQESLTNDDLGYLFRRILDEMR